MQIKRRRAFKKPTQDKKRTRVNEQIRAEKVFVVDEQGNQLGILSKKEALDKAREQDLDLVEVNPKGNPVVCKIMDYGKVKYEQQKQAHKQKVANKKSELKGIRLTFKIKGHDLETRVKQAQRFIKNGNQVKIEMVLKGREKAHASVAHEVIENFIEKVKQEHELEIIQAIKKQGGRFSAVIAPKN